MTCYQIAFGCDCGTSGGTPVTPLTMQSPSAGPYSANLCSTARGTFICVQNADNPFGSDGETPIAIVPGGQQPPGGQPGGGGGDGGYGTWYISPVPGSGGTVLQICGDNPIPVVNPTGGGTGD